MCCLHQCETDLNNTVFIYTCEKKTWDTIRTPTKLHQEQTARTDSKFVIILFVLLPLF